MYVFEQNKQINFLDFTKSCRPLIILTHALLSYTRITKILFQAQIQKNVVFQSIYANCKLNL